MVVGGGGGGGGWIKPLQTLSQGLVLSFVFCLLALSLTIYLGNLSHVVMCKLETVTNEGNIRPIQALFSRKRNEKCPNNFE